MNGFCYTCNNYNCTCPTEVGTFKIALPEPAVEPIPVKKPKKSKKDKV